MRLLLFGGRGQIGSYLKQHAELKGYQVIAPTSVDINLCNSNQTSDFIQKHQPDLVINAAAFHLVSACEENPTQAFSVNAISQISVAKETAKLEIPLVYISTDYVFDGKKQTPYTEDDPARPLQIYGISKYAGEQICLQYNPKSYIIRTAGVYGGKTGSREKKGNFVLRLLKDAEEKEHIEVSANHSVTTTYAHDLTYILFQVLEAQLPGVYHVVNSDTCTWAEFAAHILQLAGKTTTVLPVSRESMFRGFHEPLYSVLSTQKIETLHISIPTWRDAVARYLEELKAYRI